MKKLLAFVIAAAMVLSLAAPALAETKNADPRATGTVSAVRDAATVDEALNVPGGDLTFVNDATYPWVVDGDAARSGNGGISSSTSAIYTTVEASEGDIVSFDFKAFGEGSSTYWDHCDFNVDGTVVFTKGAYDNAEFESFSYGLTEGTHTLTWSYTKDSSVNPTGDYFMVDNVYVGSPAAPESITVQPVEVPAGRRVPVVYTVLPVEAYDKNVTFGTADTSVATVDEDGYVTGVAEGTTTITVTSAADPTVSGTAVVTVTEAIPPIEFYGYCAYDASGALDSKWVNFNDVDPTPVAAAGTDTMDVTYAAAFAGGRVYGYLYVSGSSDTRFYILDPETFSVTYMTTDASGVSGVFAMAYDYTSDIMYGLCGSGNARGLCTIDLATGVPTQVATITGMANTPMTLAIDDDGNAYTLDLNSSGSTLYSLDLATGAATVIGSTGVGLNYVQSTTCDLDTGLIYWAQIVTTNNWGLYCIDPSTGAATLVGTIGNSCLEITGLFIPNDREIAPIEMPEVTVTFVDGYDDAVLDTMVVEAGTVLDETDFPTPPEHEGVVFTGWDYDGSAVYTDIVITANYMDPNSIIWDFETDPEEQGFEFLDEDGDGYNWEWHYGSDWADFSFHEGSGYAASASYDNNVGALTPDNWMITPEFTGNTLTFWAQGQDPSWAAEYLGIFVSEDGGDTWSDEIANFTLTAYDTEYTVDLSAYANVRGSIRVAIRHYNITDMYVANVDYIVVSGVPSEGPEVIDLVEILGFIAPEYGANPSYQLTVPEGANYYIDNQFWMWTNPDGYGGAMMNPDDVFDNPDIRYFQQISFRANEGYVFADSPTVTLNGSTDNLRAPNVINSGWMVIQTERFAVEEPPEPVLGYYFESDDEIADFIFFDEDNDGYTWSRVTASSYAYEGTGSMGSRYNGSSEVNNWMILPEFHVPEIDPSMTFYARERTTTYGTEYLNIYAGTDPEDLSTFVQIGTMIALNHVDYRQYEFDLSEYAGQSVYIAFRHFNCSDTYFAYIDQLEFWGEYEATELIPIHAVYVDNFELPVAGELATDHLNLTVPDGANYHIIGSYWLNGDYSMLPNEVFEAGNNYSEGCELEANEGYYFADDCVFYADGITANIDFQYTYVDSNDNTVAYLWMLPIECEEELELIDTIEINDFVVPAWGENPFYNVTVPADAPYSLDYTDWNWWSYDLDDGDILAPSEFFDNADYVYYQYFEIIPNEGYAFADDVTVLINGDATIAENCGLSSLGYFWIYTIDYAVEEPEPQLITEVDVIIDLPEYGANPDFTPEVPDGAHYTISDFSWMKYNETDGDVEMAADDVFDDPDSVYYFVFEISPEDGWDFAEECTATVNGEAELVEFGFPYDGFFYGVTVDLEIEGPAAILGDVDLDGDVDVEDAILALRYAMGLIDLTDEQLAQTDVDGDGDYDLVDATLILRYAMGLIEEFPIPAPIMPED